MKIFKPFKGINLINIQGNPSTLIFTFLLGLVIMYFLIEIKNNCWISNDVKQFQEILILKLLRQTARWATAATQDENPLIAVLHANYATGFLWALKDIATISQIESTTNINMIEFQKKIVNIQDATTKKLAKVCPEYAKTDDIYLAKIAGEA